MRKRGRWPYWFGWGVSSVLLLAFLATGLLYERSATLPVLAAARALFLPGSTTHGHHQIELACEACHTRPFGGREALQQACVQCHGAALEEADDKHPARKFNDPRNAVRLDRIDAQQCVSCHLEHRPGITTAMGVTQPRDLCFHCHSGKDEMPPDHRGFAFDGCTAAGCHNYHDNRALYEDFLLKHANEPALLPRRGLPQRELLQALQASMNYPQDRYPFRELGAADADAPRAWQADPKVHAEWLSSAHARAGVNCSACHQGDKGAWTQRPSTPQACVGCHGEEAKAFQQGLHGMRLAQGLPPMTPGQARLPMQAQAAHRSLDCGSCHAPHSQDTRHAAVQACTGCHADRHTAAYADSPHAQLWARELKAELPAGAGVSCASCHMPRLRVATDDGSRMGVQHNQSDSLRPNEKMARPVCMRCHGLGFTLDALADPALVARNFKGSPARHVPGIDMAVKKDQQDRERVAGPAAQ